MAQVFVGLGSNLENPRHQVETALAELAALENTSLLAQSRLYRSRAVGPEQPDYINAVALLETQLAPLELLDQLQQLEQAHGRVRLEHWGPRTLDLDILLVGNEQIDSERLSVPHPYLTQRNFVLYPLADIAPELVLPSGVALRDLLSHCPTKGLTVIDDEEA
jgi:2-amino-4-hydroxy-6-hydroxymethyldihydropteridine diphosphokinase